MYSFIAFLKDKSTLIIKKDSVKAQIRLGMRAGNHLASKEAQIKARLPKVVNVKAG